MSEEGISTEPVANVTTEHVYYEIGGEVLDKSNTLGNILDVERFGSTLVFCNSFSDTDMVEVVLKKKGIAYYKLTTDQPRAKIQVAKLAHEHSGNVIITVDAVGQGMDLAPFDAVINYSVPAEPEVYLHRTGADGDAGKPKRALSLVGPLDFSNFHFIKKVSGLTFVKGELPSETEILKGKVNNLAKEAAALDLTNHQKVRTVAGLILEHPERDTIVHFLVHGMITGRASAAPQRQEESHDDDRGGRYGRDRYNDERGDYRRRDRDDYRDRDDSNEDGGYDGGESGGPGRRDRADEPPPAKDVRFYLGHGSRDGFTQQEFNELAEKFLNIGQDKIKRFSLRDCYSFVDLAEEDCADISTKLNDATLKNGKQLFLRKATSISAPRKQEGNARESNDVGSMGEQHENVQPDENAGV